MDAAISGAVFDGLCLFLFFLIWWPMFLDFSCTFVCVCDFLYLLLQQLLVRPCILHACFVMKMALSRGAKGLEMNWLEGT